MRNTAALLTLLVLTLLGSCASTPRDVTDPESPPVFYNLRLTIRDGQQDTFRSLMREMVTSTKAESGTLVYEWFLAADGKTCHINERFEDTAAYKVHSENFGSKFAERFMSYVEITGLTVYGNVDDTARELLSGLTPTYFAAIGGFRR